MKTSCLLGLMDKILHDLKCLKTRNYDILFGVMQVYVDQKRGSGTQTPGNARHFLVLGRDNTQMITR